MNETVKVLGSRFIFDFGPNAVYELHFVDSTHLDVIVRQDAQYPTGTLNHFDIAMQDIRPNVYMVTWVEPTGNTVTHVEDFERGVAFTNITDLASRQFWRLQGTITPL